MRIANGILVSSGIAAALLFGEGKPPVEGKEKTMTGCLTKGTDNLTKGIKQHFSFYDQKTGKKLTVTGPVDLEKHSGNHTVKITGRTTFQGLQCGERGTRFGHLRGKDHEVTLPGKLEKREAEG